MFTSLHRVILMQVTNCLLCTETSTGIENITTDSNIDCPSDTCLIQQQIKQQKNKETYILLVQLEFYECVHRVVVISPAIILTDTRTHIAYNIYHGRRVCRIPNCSLQCRHSVLRMHVALLATRESQLCAGAAVSAVCWSTPIGTISSSMYLLVRCRSDNTACCLYLRPVVASHADPVHVSRRTAQCTKGCRRHHSVHGASA